MKMLLIWLIAMLTVPGLSFALRIETKSGKQQCVTTMEKMKEKNCQIFQCENELKGEFNVYICIGISVSIEI